MPSIRKQLFLAKRHLFCPREVASYQELLAHEHMSADELEDLNWRRRQEIVRHAFNNNEFYRQKYRDVGFDEGDMKEPSDFERLPILEKQEIRDNTRRMVSEGIEPESLKSSTTGGSTGNPLKTYHDPAAPHNEISWRTLNRWRVDIADNSGYLYRAVPSGIQRYFQKLLLWPTKRNWIAALDMTDTCMERFYRQLKRDTPSYLVGYVGAIDIFANFLEQHQYNIAGLKAIWTTSAPLTENKRHYLQRVFAAPVYTQYGSCEFYWIAAECRQQTGMHIAHDLRHVEIVNGNTSVNSGEFGDILVTDLTNYAFPLIRYRLGDQGRLLKTSCCCGSPFPLMDYVKGRISDRIYLPKGGAIPGEYWTTIFDNYVDSIKSFQVHQAADFSITIYYEPTDGHSSEQAIDEVRRAISAKLGDDVSLKFTQKAVDVNDNGKTRFIVSEMTK